MTMPTVTTAASSSRQYLETDSNVIHAVDWACMDVRDRAVRMARHHGVSLDQSLNEMDSIGFKINSIESARKRTDAAGRVSLRG